MTTPPLVTGAQPGSWRDLDHPFVGEVPAFLVTEVVPTLGGQRLALAVRVPNTTVSVLLAKDDALRWADQIRAEVAKMNGLILPGG